MHKMMPLVNCPNKNNLTLIWIVDFIIIKIISTNVCDFQIVTNPTNHAYLFQ
jgi:hypothetical protein